MQRWNWIWLGVFYWTLLVAVLSDQECVQTLIPDWEDDGAESVSEVELMIDDVFGQVLSETSESQALIKPFLLEDLYFHTEQQNTIRLTGMVGYSPLEFEIFRTETVLPEKRVDLELMLPLLRVDGYYAVDRRAYNDFSSKTSGEFNLAFHNISCLGLAMLDIHSNSFGVKKVLLDYSPSDITLSVNGGQHNGNISPLITSETFKDLVIKKIWRDLVYNLNKKVQVRVDKVLTQRHTELLSEDNPHFEKYTNYVITSTQTANKLVDDILKGVKKLIINQYENNIAIPNIEEGFKALVVLRGKFVADQGNARGLSTVYRTGDAMYAKDNSSGTHFYGDLAFHQVDLYYNRYQATFMSLGPSGTLSTRLLPLTLHVHIHINFKTRKIYLDEFRVENVGDVTVSVTGLGSFINALISSISTWVVGIYRDKVVDLMENQYDNYITEILRGHNLDDIISGRAFD